MLPLGASLTLRAARAIAGRQPQDCCVPPLVPEFQMFVPMTGPEQRFRRCPARSGMACRYPALASVRRPCCPRARVCTSDMFFGQVGEMKQARGVDGCVAAYAQGGDEQLKQARGVDGCVAAYAQGGDEQSRGVEGCVAAYAQAYAQAFPEAPGRSGCGVDNRNEDADMHSGTEPLQCAREAYAQACVAAYAQAFPEAPGRSGCRVDNRK